MNRLVLMGFLYILLLAPISISQEFSLPLEKDWNLISFPVLPQNKSISNVLSSIDGNYDTVFAYDNGNWLSYYPDGYAFLNNLDNIELHKGYWVNMLNADTLVVDGQLEPEINISLYSGWNLISFPSLESRNITDILSDIEYKSVFSYKNNTWKSYLFGGSDFLNSLSGFTPGYSYWIRMNHSDVLTIRNCIEDWAVDYGVCLVNDLMLKYYVDNNACDTTYNLPLDNGTYVTCDYCTPSWTLNNTWSVCDTSDLQYKNYYDSNSCGEAGQPDDLSQSCDYCSFSVTNTSWTAWEDQGSCLENDTQPQSRSRTEYDSNYDDCYAVTGLGSDLWNSGNNNTYYEYQSVGCDLCTPSLVNTSWSSWGDYSSCLENDTQVQQRSRVQYDTNNCGEVENVTHYEYQDVACDYCTPSMDYTAWSEWTNQGSCLENDTQVQSRSRVQYDINDCGEVENVTHYEYQDVACDYCTPSLDYTSWSEWTNQGSCLENDTQIQSRSRVQYDVNNCGEVSNQTFYEYQDVACDFCTPSVDYTSWTSWTNQGSCLENDTQVQTRSRVQYDVNDCGEVENVTHYEYQDVACDFCTPSLDYTSWTSWTNQGSCLENDTQVQTRSRVEYDTNNCGEVENVTHYEYQDVACDYCTPSMDYTAWTSWTNQGSCLENDTQVQSRNRVQYDVNDCGEVSNQTFYEYQDVACDYCTPSLDYTSWSEWTNQGSCLENDTQVQSRSRVQYDINDCGEVENVTHYEYQDVACDYCTPNWVLNDTWSACTPEDLQYKNYYDTNSCNEPGTKPDDTNQSCNYCSFSVTNTSWSAWEDYGSCLINDTQVQSRNRTEYDSNYASCYAVTSLGSDLWNSGNNNTHYGYQDVACDYSSLHAPTIDSYEPLSNPSIVEPNNYQFNITFSDPDSDPVTITWYKNGSLVLTNSSTYLFTGSYSSAGVYNITVIVSDGSFTDSYEWQLTVVDTNRAPVLGLIGDYSVVEWNELIIDVNASDADGDNLTYGIDLNEGEFDTDTGILTWTPWLFDSGNYTVTFNVTDGLEVDSETITIEVTDWWFFIGSTYPNSGPIAEPDSQIFNITLDYPVNETLSVTWYLNSSIVLENETEYVFVGNYSTAGHYNVTVIVSDGFLSDSYEWELTVNNTNRAPVINSYLPSINPTIAEPDNKEFNITYSDPDGDDVDVVWYEDGELVCIMDYCVFDSDYSSAGVYNITAVISDGSLSDSQEWQLTVDNTNRAPTVDTVTAPSSVNENDILQVSFTASDLDNDDLNYYIYKDGVLVNISDSFSWQTVSGDKGTYNFTFKVNDTFDYNDSESVLITVNDTTAPVISLTSPVNKYYTNRNVDVNLTTNEAANCTYTLFNGSSNTIVNNTVSTSDYTNFTQTIDTLQDSLGFNVTVYCSDSAGNVASSSEVFKVDTLKPNFVGGLPSFLTELTGSNQVESYYDSLDIANVTFYIADGDYNGSQNIVNSSWREICFMDSYTGFSNFSCSWDTSADPYGGRVFVKWSAVDNAGNIAEYPLVFNDTNYIDVDNTPPGNVTGFDASIPSKLNSVHLSWINPKENGLDGGPVDYYDIRYSTSPITDFAAASVIPSEGFSCSKYLDNSHGESLVPGTIEECNVTKLFEPNGTKYYFAIKAIDDIGLESAGFVNASSVTGVFDAEVLWMNLTLMKNGEKYNDSVNTIYQYDLINVTGEVRNNGNRDEEVLVKLWEAGWPIQNQTINISANETKNVSFVYNSTKNDTNILLVLSSSLPNDMNGSNDDKNVYIDSWSVRDWGNLSWDQPSSNPSASETASTNFYVDVRAYNLRTDGPFYEFPLSISINDSFTIDNVFYNAGTYVGDIKQIFFPTISSQGNQFAGWEVIGLPANTYNITIIAGEHPEDQRSITRIVTVSEEIPQ